jgi:signal transduction histidine kinase
LWVDTTAVGQILDILLENALAHSPAGSPVIVEATLTDEEATIAVSNAGSIPPRDLPHVFAAFHRSEDATSSGVGLGLYIASRLAQSMGSTVEASASSGTVTFALRMPVLSPPLGTTAP